MRESNQISKEYARIWPNSKRIGETTIKSERIPENTNRIERIRENSEESIRIQEKINASSLKHIPVPNAIVTDSRRQPHITQSALELEIDSNTFEGGKARLQCVASLFHLYKREVELIVEEEKPRPRPSSELRTRDAADFRIESYYLMESPIQPALVTIAYLALVLKIVPFFMRKKSPFELKAVMVLYNSSQIVINTYYVLMGLHIYTASNILCAYTDISGSPDLPYAVTGHYHYLMIKILDFVETIIFVLRKKNNQVTFLHLFHHSGVFWLSWICFKYSPGGHPYLCSVINSFVHIFMYSYYLVTLWIDVKAIWWKHYMTMLQIVSQCLITLLFSVALLNPYCSYPKWVLVVNVAVLATILYLFFTFYNVSYVSKKRSTPLQHFFLMQSPIQPLFLVVAYLGIVLKIGPNFMKNRQPLNLRVVIIIYNLIQIASNAALVIMALPTTKTFDIMCTYTDTSNLVELPFIVIGNYLYLLLKLFHFGETIIFVLRKKDNQVSFLHVFHHVGVFLIGWICCKFSPGAIYLIVVTKLGRSLMKNRAPLKLNYVMILYNVFQISSNLLIIILGFPHLNTISFLCTITSPDFYIIITLHHKFVLLKLIDFLETIIFILRKKDKQVSFLHVFHHTGVFLMAWISFKYSPGGANCLSAFINCIVHTVMYFYYLQSTWTKEKFQWWKKYITVLQVVANSIILLNYVVHLVNPFCSFPKWILVTHLIYMFVILHLFVIFYKKSYVGKQAKLS
ncbi:hypothetical protein Zmor_025996 [Zophobas morio]|uniref:Elongation of very long chain fatty acids protein n=1 Tax=Zophobas morio TaxID=2755281 RepID=A0AA38HSQ9_9CUCU|nr:hypothetical protein Zmor_025996 [Zophobas morio]